MGYPVGYCYCLALRKNPWIRLKRRFNGNRRREKWNLQLGCTFWKSLPSWQTLRTCFLLSVWLLKITCTEIMLEISWRGYWKLQIKGRVTARDRGRTTRTPVCLFSTWVRWQDVAEFRWLDSHPWLHTGPVHRRPHSLWGLTDTTRLPNRPYVGSGVGVPFWYSAAVSSGSRWWVTPPAA